MKSKQIQICVVSFLLGASGCTKYKQDLDVDWSSLNSKQYTIKYLQHNFDPFVNDNTMDIEVEDFADSPNLVTLDSVDVVSMVQLISDSSNFTLGECGTFAFNAGMIVFQDDVIKGMVSIGCGYTQWQFEPFNPNCRFGRVNSKGFEIMTKLLDDINDKNETLKTTH